MEEVQLKIDSKGRLCIPAEIRKQIGEVVTLKKTPEGYLIVPGKQADFLEEFRKIVTSKPRRTGKPENWSPARMKAIWSKTEE
ncbi:MAG TPA: MraZ N-terminal domain-containing protein [Candidatus Bathyarchaeia archaeon]|nr:MraZ N-terminal domain-containing protein [Candidatus Bathyarchaeia archaeon]